MMIIAVFRSRTHSLDYLERLRGYGVQANTVPTPKEARIGCGLCVQFDVRYFARAQAILKVGRYSSFKGFYKTEFLNGRMSITPYR
ncbi:MAG: DUF3343 domain-containing protein [Clostridiales bacterium]|nr:DUF3343 domain-containing protein [Clostridiales bacterium]